MPNKEKKQNSSQLQIDPDASKHWFTRLIPIILAHKKVAWAVVIITLATALLHVAIPPAMGNAVDILSLTNSDTMILYYAVSILLIISISRAITGHFSRKAMYNLSYSVEADLRQSVYTKLTKLPLSFFDKAPSGQIVSRANSDIRSIQAFLIYVPFLVVAFLSFFFSLIYMFTINISLALITLIFLPGIFFLSHKARNLLFPLSWLVQSRMAETTVIIDENLNAQFIVKAFGKELQQIKMLSTAAKKLEWAANKIIDIKAKYRPLIENLAAYSQAFILLYGGWLVMNETILLGDLVTFNIYITLMQVPFQVLGIVLVISQKASASAIRIYEVLDHKEVNDNAHNKELKVNKGTVKFEKVNFSFHPSSEEKHTLFNQLNFDLKPGRIVALVGKSGSGKSTVADLLLRFYEVQGGRIVIDGHDIKDVTLSSLRKNIELCPNEPFIFASSIKDNIKYSNPSATDEEVINAAKSAHAHEFIENLSDGYDTIVGERGISLSGGQRQRLGIARLMLSDSKILILDDCTHALDITTEQIIFNNLKNKLANKTTLIITHRISTIKQADQVLILESGSIIDKGSHDLLTQSSSSYQKILALINLERQKLKEADATLETDEEYFSRLTKNIQKPEID